MAHPVPGCYPEISGLQNLTPALPTHTKSLAPYISVSPTLHNLIDIGVDLSIVQQSLNSGEIVNLLELDVGKLNNIVLFLVKVVGISENILGDVLTKNPSKY